MTRELQLATAAQRRGALARVSPPLSCAAASSGKKEGRDDGYEWRACAGGDGTGDGIGCFGSFASSGTCR